MARYVVVRSLSLVVSILIATVAVFAIMHAIPGGPFDAEKAPLTAAQQANLMRFYGLDQPLPVQYLRFLGGAMHLQFGYSYQEPGETITDLLAQTWPVSALVGGMGLLLGILLGLALGIAAAMYHNSPIDYLLTTLAVVTTTLPPYIVSIVLVLIFSLALRWFPPSGWNGPSTWVLPTLAYAFIPVGSVMRYTRASMLDVASRSYVVVARAKGLARSHVMTRHVLRNAWRPILTVTLPLVPAIMTGSILVESIFRVPGLGMYFVTSISKRDYPLELALIFIVTLLTGVTFLVTDILYTLLDPRLRLSGSAA